MGELSPAQALARVKEIKQRLNQSHDTDTDYLPRSVRDMRMYIFQVHAEFEQTLDILVTRDYLEDKAYGGSSKAILREIPFAGKLKIVKRQNPEFPRTCTEKVNDLRNGFAHEKGADLRSKYLDEYKQLEVFEFLLDAHDKLNRFWEQS